jgi:hypothetical protein
MGGPGSGDWYRWDKRCHVHSRPYIDIRFLKQQGKLFAGASFELNWDTGRNEDHVSIDCQVKEDRLVIDYEIPGPNDRQEKWQNVIDFDFTLCHFGGKRTWFLCPVCRKRVAVVHKSQLRYACRHCCDLVYLSQSQTKEVRMMLKAKMIHFRLGGTGDIACPFPPKPKGMHWRTYLRLHKQEIELLQPTWDKVIKQYETNVNNIAVLLKGLET